MRNLETKNAPEGVGLADIQKAIEAHTAATATTIAGLTGQIDGLKATLFDLEQKAADRFIGAIGGTSIDGAGALAQELVKNDLWQQVARKKTVKTSVEVKASHLLGLETKNTITGNDSNFSNSAPAGVFPGLMRRRFLRDFLNTIPVAQGSIEWSKETTFTNNAGVQTGSSPAEWEGQAKAESALVYTLQDSRIPTVAHFIKASNQILADVPQLRNLIETRLRYGLNVKIDDLIVNGAPDVKGWTHADNHTVFTPASGESGIDSINRAIATLETNEASATLVLLNPLTYRSLQRVKASGGSEEYLFGSPSGQNRESIWNVAVLPTNAITATKVMVLDVAQQGDFYVREDARVDVGFVNDDFTKNLVTIRAELRALSVTVRKEAVIYGALTT